MRWFKELCITSTVVSVVIALTCFLTSCASSIKLKERAHIVMNHVTDIADPSYSLAVVACDGREGFLIDECRDKGDACDVDQLRMDVDSTRVVCDKIFMGFESLRAAQINARKLVDSAGEDMAAWERALEASEAALDTWRDVRALIMETPWIAKEAPSEP